MSFDFFAPQFIGNELPWLCDFRSKGRSLFESKGIPSAKTEEWKYTKPNRFFAQDFHFKQTILEKHPQIKLPFDAYYIWFENGVFNPFCSTLPEGIEVLPIIEAIMFRPDTRQKIGALADCGKYPFAALNAALLNEGVYINIDSNVDITKPLVIVCHATPSEGGNTYNLRNLFNISSGSSVKIIEYFCYSGEVKSSYFTNVVNEIYLAEGASLYHTKVQDEAFKAAHIALSCINLQKNSTYQSFCLQKGGDMSRNEVLALLSEEGAKSSVDAAYIMNGWATIDTTTEIKHLAPNTKSNQLIKGVVGGQAKGVFQGKIHIAPNAVKTEGYQLHKSMLLSDSAEIDVKPELEIFADDVKCSHGSACGELDQEQLFYMRSRGIKEHIAKQLLIDAYLNDVIAMIGDENVREWIKLLLGCSLSK